MNEAYTKLVRALADGGILHRFPDLADAVWLACLGSAPSAAAQPEAEPVIAAAELVELPSTPLVALPPSVPPAATPSPARPPEFRMTPLHIDLPGAEPEQLEVVVLDPEQRATDPYPRVPPGPQIFVPPPASLPDRDRFVRQLKLLRRLHPSARRSQLDLRATIQRFCDEEIPEPVFSPGFESSLNLTFLLDSSPTMDLWRTMACELFQVLQASGAFVRCRALLWSWEADGQRVRPVFSSLEPTKGESPACLSVSTGEPEVQVSARDVVFLFSDCTA
jgi:hypothetical protein